MKVESESEVAQLCPTLSDPMDRSLLGSSIHGIFQARVLEWGAIAFSNVQTIHSLRWFDLKASDFMVCGSDTHSIETTLWILHFDLCLDQYIQYHTVL